VVNVRVTAAGEALVASRRAARAERLTEWLGTLPPGQQDVLAMALPALKSLAEVSAR
jgi:hypothetical protein